MMKQTREIFSQKFVNWLVAVVAGFVMPLITQTYIAIAIASFDKTPRLEPIVTYSTVTAAFVLIAAGLMFMIGFSYQVRYVALLKTHSSVWALITTMIGPFIVWFGLPLLLGM